MTKLLWLVQLSTAMQAQSCRAMACESVHRFCYHMGRIKMVRNHTSIGFTSFILEPPQLSLSICPARCVNWHSNKTNAFRNRGLRLEQAANGLNLYPLCLLRMQGQDCPIQHWNCYTISASCNEMVGLHPRLISFFD